MKLYIDAVQTITQPDWTRLYIDAVEQLDGLDGEIVIFDGDSVTFDGDADVIW